MGFATTTVALLTGMTVAMSATASPWDLDTEFGHFLRTFRKSYEAAERELRRAIFRDNLRYIDAENAKGHDYVLGITAFADLTPEEFAAQRLGFKAPAALWGSLPRMGRHRRTNRTLPTAVDWRANGAVTSVKNQAACGSCWSFSTTGALEGAWKIATGKLVSLSEQQFVDCSSGFGNAGCKGGSMDAAFQYAKGHGICSEADYPYKATNGTCKASDCQAALPLGAVQGFHDVAAEEEDALQDAVAQQPVSIAIEADKQIFQFYKSGVLSGACGSKLDHGVLAVGYGESNGTKYWIVKNSWGPSWGMQGFAMLLRGKGGAGECGIAESATYPIVHGQDEAEKASAEIVV